jgi:hypothetical protein
MDRTRNYIKTLDKIDNLVIRVKIYDNMDYNVLDEIQSKWQQKTFSLQRCLFTEINDEIETLGQIKENNNELERKIDEFPIEEGQSLFMKPDTSTTGVSRKDNQKRWNKNLSKSINVTMRFMIQEMYQKLISEPNITPIPIELCRIEYFGKGQFSIKVFVINQPDFTKPKELHSIQLKNDTIYYEIINESPKLSEANEEKEQLIFEEFFKRLNISRIDNLPFQEFEPLLDSNLKYFCRLEIESALYFYCDFIFIEYLVCFEAPFINSIQNPTKLEGVSQIASLEKRKDGYEAHFGYPIEITLCQTTTENAKSPKIYFKLISLDNKNRQQTVGYGDLKLLQESGSHFVEIKTWKPKLHFQSSLKSYFLGGGPDLDDLKFNELKTINNHYGFKTESSGSLKLKYQVIIQEYYILI